MNGFLQNFYIDSHTMYVSIVTGIVSSAVFLLILSFLKPKISISNEIAQKPSSSSNLFIFKIINKSPIFKIYDVTVKVYSKKKVASVNAEDEEIEVISLRLDYQRVLHRFNWKHCFQDFIHGKRRLRTRTDYAAQFSTFSDLNDIIAQGKFIEIEVYAKHALTGFSKIFTREYKHPNNIVAGSFCSGNTFTIK